MRKDARGASVPGSRPGIRGTLQWSPGKQSIMRWTIFLWILMILFADNGWADEKIKVGEVVVTASRLEESVQETTSEVTVLKAEDIKKMNVVLVPDVLRKVPDLNVVQTGGDGRLTQVFLRGGDPKETLVMVDGVKVNSISTGGFDFSKVSVDDIERIEIVKGSQSTMYGSEAMAGVINIITKKGEGKPRIVLSFEGGSYGTYSPSLSISGSEGILSYRVTGLYFNTQGISAAKDGTETDSYRNGYMSWNFGVKPSANSEVEIFGNYSSDRSGLDDFDFVNGRAIDSLTFVQHGYHYLVAARGKLYLFDKWEQVLTVSGYGDLLKFTDPAVQFNNANVFDKRLGVDWQNNVHVTEALTLTAGLAYQHESTDNLGNFDEGLNDKAAYLNSKLKFFNDSLILNAGLRYDDYSTVGSKTTYRVGAAYTNKDVDATVRASYATGFRVPSLNDLFFPFYGNPSLKPEESKSFEAGILKPLFRGKLQLGISYFNTDYTNLIQADPLTFTAVNIANASIKGVEATASFQATDALSLKAGYTYLDAKDTDTHLPLNWRPTNKVVFGVAYSTPVISLLADYNYVSGRFNSSHDAEIGKKLSPYWLVNLSGTYKVSKILSLFVRIENLFDADYEEVLSYGTKGTSVYGGMRATF
jgi:vitamin B12 transporter